jgi:hypothetical protein
MSDYLTRFASMDHFEKGGVSIIDDDPRNYVFSNIYEVTAAAKPFEKVAVAKNLQYVLEAIRVEGTSPWRTSSHDEFALVMSGVVTFDFVDLADADGGRPTQGSVQLDGEPDGSKMGQVVARRGHMVLLAARSAYRYRSDEPAALLLQTIVSGDTVFRWAEICQTR